MRLKDLLHITRATLCTVRRTDRIRFIISGTFREGERRQSTVVPVCSLLGSNRLLAFRNETCRRLEPHEENASTVRLVALNICVTQPRYRKKRKLGCVILSCSEVPCERDMRVQCDSL